MSTVLQQIGLEIPIFMAPACDISRKCYLFIESLCKKSHWVKVTDFPQLKNKCEEDHLITPQIISFHAFSYTSLSDMIKVMKSLNDLTYSYYTQSFNVILFIDCELSTDVQKVKDMCLDDLNQFNIYFVLYNAPLELTSLSSENTCVILSAYSDNLKQNSALDFFSFIAVESAISFIHQGFNSNPDPQFPFSLRIHKVRADFEAISSKYSSSYQSILSALQGADVSYLEFIASLYEFLALIELQNPIVQPKQLPTFNLQPPKWAGQDNVSYCLGMAFSAFDAAKAFARAADCGIRLIVNHLPGSNEVIQYISSHAINAGMQRRAWDVLTYFDSYGFKRKVVFLAYQFSTVFDIGSNDFRLFALRKLLSSCNHHSLYQIRELIIPLAEKLTVQSPDIVSQILSASGPELGSEQQEKLFKIIEGGCNRIDLALSIRRAFFETSDCVIKQKKADPSVFIYSHLQKEEGTILANRALSTVCLEIMNPFAVSFTLNDVSLGVDNSIPQTVFLEKKQKTTIYLRFRPIDISHVSIDSINFKIFGTSQTLSFSPIEADVISNVAPFSLRTDLPVTSPITLFHGEIKTFFLWITNTGQTAINSLVVDFGRCNGLCKTEVSVLQPQESTCLECELIADVSINLLELVVKAESSACVFKEIDQPLDVIPSLSVRRIFKIDSDSQKMSLGFEIANFVKSTLQYHGTVSGRKISDLIGSEDSVLASGEFLLSELRNGPQPSKRSLVEAIKVKEAELERSLTTEERALIKKVGSISEAIKKEWDVEWLISDLRKGKVMIDPNAIDDAIIREIDGSGMDINVNWPNDIHETDVVPFFVSFGEDVACCEIEAQGTLLEGEKLQRNSNSFEFRLCFPDPGEYTVVLNYSGNVSGRKVLNITVV